MVSGSSAVVTVEVSQAVSHAERTPTVYCVPASRFWKMCVVAVVVTTCASAAIAVPCEMATRVLSAVVFQVAVTVWMVAVVVRLVGLGQTGTSSGTVSVRTVRVCQAVSHSERTPMV